MVRKCSTKADLWVFWRLSVLPPLQRWVSSEGELRNLRNESCFGQAGLQLSKVHGLKCLECRQRCALVSLWLLLVAELLYMQHVVGGPWAKSLQVRWRLNQNVLCVLPTRVGMSSSMQSLIWTFTEPLFSSAWDWWKHDFRWRQQLLFPQNLKLFHNW